MSDVAVELIHTFSALSRGEQHAVLLELARISEANAGPLSDEELTAAGESVFAMYDAEEAGHGEAEKGEVWLVDMGYAAKVRPALVLSGPVLDHERALTTVIPHTTSVRGTRFEIPTNVGWLNNGAFDVQGIGTDPTIKLMRKLGDLSDELLGLVESRVVMLLALPAQPQSG